jgi:hypothetical protein
MTKIKNLTRGEKLRRIRAAMKTAGLKIDLNYSERRPKMHMQRVKWRCRPTGGWVKLGLNKTLIHSVAFTMFPDCLFFIDELPSTNTVIIRLYTKL